MHRRQLHVAGGGAWPQAPVFHWRRRQRLKARHDIPYVASGFSRMGSRPVEEPVRLKADATYELICAVFSHADHNQNTKRSLRASTFAASRPGTFFRSSIVAKRPCSSRCLTIASPVACWTSRVFARCFASDLLTRISEKFLSR